MVILQSPNDKSSYRSLVLDNRMTVVLISDKDTDMSAAALNVGVGNLQDRPDHLGLAHFLEHMLFMGTKKYPDVNTYNSFIKGHGGSSNAYTANENTCYFFNIHNKNFLEALDIFGHFFIDPLFDKNTVDKEMNAVNSEHSKNINSDAWRFQRTVKMVAREEHSFSNFGCGNLETLQKPDIRQDMIDFYQQYYSANIMKLVVLSNKSLDELEAEVKKVFNQVPNKDFVHSSYNGQPYDLSRSDPSAWCYKLVKTVPVQDNNSLQIMWQLPSMKTNSNKSLNNIAAPGLSDMVVYKPLEFISSLLGHESEGSVISVLKNKGLATAGQCGLFSDDRSSSMLVFGLDLTDLGFKHVDTIVSLLYRYIAEIKRTLKQDTPKIEMLYNELRNTAKTTFKFLPKSDADDRVLSVAENLMDLPVDRCLSANYLYKQYSDKTNTAILDIVDRLVPSRSVVVLSSKKFRKIATSKERYYGIMYHTETGPKSLGDEFKSDAGLDRSVISLPVRNRYIVKNTPIIKSKTTSHPKKLKLSTNHTVYYKINDLFNNPKVVVSVIVFNRQISASPDNYLALMLYTRLVKRELTSSMYYARLAGSSFSVNTDIEKTTFTFSAYSEKIERLISDVMDKFVKLTTTRSLFSSTKKEVFKDLKNVEYSTPLTLAFELFNKSMYNTHYDHKTLLTALDRVTADKIAGQIRTMLYHNCRLVSFVGGSVKKRDVRQLLKHFDPFVSKTALSLAPILKVKKINPGTEKLLQDSVYNADESDSAVQLFYEVGVIKKDSANWAKTLSLCYILENMINEPFFTQLRSKEQNGYIVKSSLHVVGSSLKPLYGVLFFIQSSKDPDHLITRIKVFVDKFRETVDQLNKSDIDKFISTVVKSMTERVNSMYEQFGRYIGEIQSGKPRFDYREDIVKAVNKITIKDVVEFYDRVLGNKSRHKLVVTKISSKHGTKK